MKSVSLALAVSILAATVAVPAALACGSYGTVVAAPAPRDRAVGVWPSIERADGAVNLYLNYPKFAVSGHQLYGQRFVVVADRALRRLERQLAVRSQWALEVSVEEVAPDRWRVTGWRELPGATGASAAR